MSSPQDLGLLDQAALIAAGEASPADLLDAVRARRAERDRELGAIADVFGGDLGGELAETAVGPLHGVPIGVKEAIALPWRAPHDGTPIAAPAVPAGASGVVRRLRAAGALPLVATRMHQLGIGTTGHVAAGGPTRNPLDPSRCAGGSSGGSAAAVAAGILAGAVGTDAGGSIRIPASYCGVVGLKPTWGAIPLDGCTASYSSVAVAGPIARDAVDCRALAAALLGRPLPPGRPSSLRIALPGALWEDVAPAVHAPCRAAVDRLADAGAEVTEAPLSEARHAALAIAVTTGVERLPQLTDVWLSTVFPLLDAGVRGIIKARAMLDAGTVQRVLRLRSLLRRRVSALLADVDLLVAPTVPAPPPPLARPRVSLPSGRTSADLGNLQQVGLANLTGIPAITVPCGRDDDGLPVGLTLHAAWGREALLLDAAERLEGLGLDHGQSRLTAGIGSSEGAR
jgi:aspartyl-tRNA(Asn)/glutamyl-tRNA(Gln) amidotransferase subunit A